MGQPVVKCRGCDHTIVFRKNQTLTTKALGKLGHFEPRLSTLKVMPWLWVSISNRYVLDLPNKILNIDIGQGAAKISEVKVGGQKKSARSAGPQVHRVRDGPHGQFLNDLQL